MFKVVISVMRGSGPRVRSLRRTEGRCVLRRRRVGTRVDRLNGIVYSRKINRDVQGCGRCGLEVRSLRGGIATQGRTIRGTRSTLRGRGRALLTRLRGCFRRPLFGRVCRGVSPRPCVGGIDCRVVCGSRGGRPRLCVGARTSRHRPCRPRLFFDATRLGAITLDSFLDHTLSLAKVPVKAVIVSSPIKRFSSVGVLKFTSLVQDVVRGDGGRVMVAARSRAICRVFHQGLPPRVCHSHFVSVARRWGRAFFE